MRQRLARQQLEDGSHPESALATLLVTLFAWGVFSPQRVQEIAHLAISDFDRAKESGNDRILDDLRGLASIGTYGAHSGKCHSDLMNKVGKISKLPEPLQVKIDLKPPMNTAVQGILLPHEVFNAIYRFYPKTWTSSILPSLERMRQFRGSVSGHPQMQNHPLLEREGYNQWTIPIAIHGDGVPIVGIGKGWSRVMTLFSWYSLLGQGATSDLLIWVWGVYDKLLTGSLREEHGSLFQFFKILRWSFMALWEGKWPSANHEGKEKLDWITMYMYYPPFFSWACTECIAVFPFYVSCLG